MVWAPLERRLTSGGLFIAHQLPMVVYPASAHTEREARSWAVQTMMFAANVADNGAFTIDDADAYSKRIQHEAESAEQELWSQCNRQLLAYVRSVFEWCDTRRVSG